jgi:DNA-binding GntR family transcriptional regulator
VTETTATTNTAEDVHRELRARILAGELAPDERLVVRTWATRFGTSDLPVREAIRMLQQDGLVQVERHRGARVISLTPDDIPGAYLLRGELESLVTKLAGPHMSTADLDHLQSCAEEMAALAEQDQMERYSEVNRQFHTFIFDKCPFPNIRAEAHRLWSGQFDFGVIFGVDPGQVTRSCEDHFVLVAHLRQRDWDGAAWVTLHRKLEAARTLLVALDRPIPEALSDAFWR